MCKDIPHNEHENFMDVLNIIVIIHSEKAGD